MHARTVPSISLITFFAFKSALYEIRIANLSFIRASLVAQTVKNLSLALIHRLGRSPGEENGLPTPVFLPREFHGQKSLASYNPKELGTTE